MSGSSHHAARLRAARAPLWAACGAALVALLACANPGVLPVQKAGSIENPEGGIGVRIEHIEDRRGFQDFPGRSFTPTLADDDGDPARRSRAVGRGTIRGGGAGANVFLAPGLSVESIIAEAVTRALQDAGFRVLASGDPGHPGAVPLQVGIEQLWMMKNRPSEPAYAEVEIRVRISGPVPGLERGAVSEVRKKVGRGGWSRGMWRQALEKGLDKLTKEASVELAIVRTSLDASPLVRPLNAGASPPPAPLRATPPPAPESTVDFGRYHLLAIGIDAYDGLPRLKTAVGDARAVAAILGQDYDFETRVLVNATRADIIQAFSEYREKLGPEDNLLVYYAGHGWNDEEAGLGYWLPIDASPDDETNWVSNAKITSILRAMRAKHVMVVSDSCYSGTLTRGIQVQLESQRKNPDYIERLASRRTRLALASGGNEPVDDGGGGKHSVFANAFLRALSENDGVLDATSLHSRIRTPVLRDSDQTPQFGPIRRARHEDGDFFFVRSD